MTNYRSGRGRRNGCILILFVIAAIVIFIMIRGCDKKEQVEDYGQNTMKMAFKPELPLVDENAAINACDRVVYGVIGNPEKAAKLVSINYATSINKAVNEQVKKGRLKADQKQGLVHALQGIMMIESGGSSLPSSGVGACGIVQMLASTAHENGLKVSTDSAKTSRLLLKARKGDRQAYAKLAKLDERFDPFKCIRGGANFLTSLFARFGSWDFTVAAYHGGQGNINKLVRKYLTEDGKSLTYKHGRWQVAQDIKANGLTYAKIFFGCSPTHYPETYQFLRIYKSAKKDFSGWYYWNTTAAARAVSLYQNDRKTFRQTVWNWKNLTVSRRRELMPKSSGIQKV